jgi:hypothetical protein
LQNGGFENGVSGWQIVQDAGFVMTTNNLKHTGRSSLWLNAIPAPPGNPLSVQVVSASQTVEAKDLVGLQLTAWYATYMTSPFVIGKLHFQLDSMVIDYVVYGSKSGSSTDRYVLVTPDGCPVGWCLLQRDLITDLGNFYGQDKVTSTTQSRTIQITVTLEILRYGKTSEYIQNEPMYWDDVDLEAFFPLQSTTTSALLSQPTTETNTSSTAPASAGMSSVSATVTAPLSDVGFTRMNGTSLGIIVVAALVLCILFLTRRRREEQGEERTQVY